MRGFLLVGKMTQKKEHPLMRSARFETLPRLLPTRLHLLVALEERILLLLPIYHELPPK